MITKSDIRSLHARETKLNDIDMGINFKKSSCIRIGLRNDATCASNVSFTLNDHVIHWMTEVRYLGIYVVSSEYLNVHCIILNVVFIARPTQFLEKWAAYSI